jgi:hypothetical protein
MILILRSVILSVLAILFLFTHGRTITLSEKQEDTDKKMLQEKVERGLNYLARTQNQNGSWTCRVGYKLNDTYQGEEYDNVGVTAICGIAFLSQGSTPGRGKYGQNVEKAIQFVLSCSRKTDGYITRHGSRMYEHGFATLFLAEAYGMSKREDIKEKLRKSAQLIIASQNSNGGWRYQPAPIDSDISVTVTILQALRATRNVGIAVPKEVIDKAVQYVKRSQQAGGAFNYQLTPPSRVSFALTAAGVTSLLSAGEYDTPAIQQGIRFMLNNMPAVCGDYHYFYGHYYAVQSFFQAGGKNCEQYFRRLQNEIIPKQLPDGSWTDDVGSPYATAMACIILQITNDYLPIFQK